ncbi:ABC transporter permease [Pararhizobium haloflavum]|uniref:ABC transporter permease n=1 Tax=Pararhizobium haloflavum TaxID=2037914 RepID=UPI000C1928C1|nr:ABC transporter permease [Pararhizobium haloflavum]
MIASPRHKVLPALDKLGVFIAIGLLATLGFAPLMVFRANRIVLGETVDIAQAMPPGPMVVLLASIGVAGVAALLKTSAMMRLIASLAAIAVLAWVVGVSASFLVEGADAVARASPASGFWLLFGIFALMATDALTRMDPKPSLRIGLVLLAGLALAAFLASGIWDDLSVMREYENRAGSFAREARRHLFLAFGSLFMAALAGIPLGILCHQVRAVRGPVLSVLNIMQTVPSIALFGLLIAPLSWLSTELPILRAIGVSGIGAAPAFIALFFYSLLPVVANTVTGLAGIPANVSEAATGMGMTERQRLFSVKLPLAFPVILTGIRIVLVQNIGLATIAALIGGGGFGVFVFQGVGQTAMDLVLLGALPTVTLAFAAAVIMDALVDIMRPSGVQKGSQ